ncbi:MAG: site-specific integrase [Chitinophagaceae bacterium]|nr:site-specific integrase [Chitinophagaceae bacterium]
MITLPNGCWCSDIKVHPKNWESGGATIIKHDWYFHYRFYDPRYKHTNGKIKPKLCIKKGMNSYRTLAERRASTTVLVKNEWKLLKEDGYNPITNTFTAPIEMEYEIDPETGFTDALDKAYKKIKRDTQTMTDLKSVLKYFTLAAKLLRYDTIPISQIKRKHVRLVLDNCAKVKDYWSSNQFNYFRSYISMLFSQLEELEAIDINPVIGIKKEKTVRKLRKLLNAEERKIIDKHFFKTDKYYHRFIHLFFHSGARIKELLQIKKEDVSLKNQTYKITLKKGKSYKEQLRPIKNIAVQYWEQVYGEALSGQYLFGKYLKPGDRPSTRDYITKKWQREVKGKRS